MRIGLRITIGIAAAVAIVVLGLSAAWSLWGRALWAPEAAGRAEPSAQGREATSQVNLGTTQDGSSQPGTALTIEQAQTAAEAYVQNMGHMGLAIAEVIEFEQSFYVAIREVDSGVGAMELLVDKTTGSVSPELGPNMMWNVRYGVHRLSTMTMGSLSQVNAISEAQAIEIAQHWLAANRPGVTAEERANPFYGYYSIHTVKDGTIEGLLSVHGTTGQVWYHTWHGAFVQMLEPGG